MWPRLALSTVDAANPSGLNPHACGSPSMDTWISRISEMYTRSNSHAASCFLPCYASSTYLPNGPVLPCLFRTRPKGVQVCSHAKPLFRDRSAQSFNSSFRINQRGMATAPCAGVVSYSLVYRPYVHQTPSVLLSNQPGFRGVVIASNNAFHPLLHSARIRRQKEPPPLLPILALME